MLRREADLFYNAKLKAALEEMNVDMLSQGKQNRRVSYLHSNKIDNIWQLSKLSHQQLSTISGIGTQTATKIYDLTKQIVQNTREKLSLRINADNPSKEDNALVTTLYRLIVHNKQRVELTRIYED